MGKRLVIAEKPMLAKAILDAIPGTAKSIKAGERVFYTEKGDYLVVALLVKGLTSAKGTKYDAWVCMEDTGRGVFLKLSFDDLPQKKGKKRGTN